MSTTPREQQTPSDAIHVTDATGLPPLITIEELAARWHRKRKTVERRYGEWGLRPLRFGGRLLFTVDQVLDVEQRAIRGELVRPAEHAAP